MALIPTLNVSDMQRSLSFYTDVLDFTLSHAWPEPDPAYAVLRRERDELHLSGFGGKPFGHAVIVVVSDVDSQFALYQARGLKASAKTESPVHQAPLDQTWGTREVYIDDPDGNTLVLQQR